MALKAEYREADGEVRGRNGCEEGRCSCCYVERRGMDVSGWKGGRG